MCALSHSSRSASSPRSPEPSLRRASSISLCALSHSSRATGSSFFFDTTSRRSPSLFIYTARTSHKVDFFAVSSRSPNLPANPQLAAAERIPSSRSAPSTTDALLGTFVLTTSTDHGRRFSIPPWVYINGQRAGAVPSPPPVPATTPSYRVTKENLPNSLPRLRVGQPTFLPSTGPSCSTASHTSLSSSALYSDHGACEPIGFEP